MKKLFFLFAFASLLVACSSDDAPVMSSIELSANETEEFMYGENREFPIILKDIASTSISAPKGWVASIKDNKLAVTAPEKGKADAISTGRIEIKANKPDNTTEVISINVKAFYLITFEGVETKYLAGPTAYGENLYSDYTDTNPEIYHGYHDIQSDLFFHTATDFYTGGIAISQWNNKTTASYTNQCSVYFGEEDQKNGGNNNSKTFAVNSYSAFEESGNYMYFYTDGAEHLIDHLYITNTTYTSLVMKNGNQYANALTYEDKSWFKLTIEGVNAADQPIGKVDFYLADFRTKEAEGIVNGWKRVDLSSLGKVHKLKFTMSGSDGEGTMLNTPAYFCMDDIAVVF